MDNLAEHNPDIVEQVEELSLLQAESRLSEIMTIIKEHYRVGSNGQLDPKLRAESIIIVDYIDKLKHDK